MPRLHILIASRFDEYLSRTALTISVFLALVSCSRDEIALNSHKGPKSGLTYKEKVDYLVSCGHSRDEISEFEGDVMLGDGVLKDDLFIDCYAKHNTSNLAIPVSWNNAGGMWVYLDPSLHSSWATAMLQAMAEFDLIPNCRVHFGQSSFWSPGTDVIRFYTWTDLAQPSGPDGNMGGAAWPGELIAPGVYGPGDFIWVRTENYYPGWTAARKKYWCFHLLMHSVGISHNTPSSILGYTMIPGTANYNQDANSVQRVQAGTANTPVYGTWNSSVHPSIWDKYALSLMYPDPQPLPNTIPLYRYAHNATSNSLHCHFYTTNWLELAGNITFALSPWQRRYLYEGIECRLPVAGVPGVLPLYRAILNGNDIHWYTTDINDIGANWTLEGVIGGVWPTQQAGTIPLKRYANSQTGDHIWTVSNTAPPPPYFFELVVGYVYPGPLGPS